MLPLLLALASLLLWPVRPTAAAESSMSLHVAPAAGTVSVTVTNDGDKPITAVEAAVALGGHDYPPAAVGSLAPGEERRLEVVIAPPLAQGSQPLVTRARFSGVDGPMSVVNVAYYDGATPRRLVDRPRVDVRPIREQGTVTVAHDPRYRVRLVLPAEMTIVGEEHAAGKATFRLRHVPQLLTRNYSSFVVLETEPGDTPPGLLVLPLRLTGMPMPKAGSWFGARSYGAVSVLALLVSFFLYRRSTRGGATPAQGDVALVRWCFSIFTVSLLLLLYRTLHVVPDWALPRLETLRFEPGTLGSGLVRVGRTLAGWLYFEGGDYDLFSRHVADPLYLYVLGPNLLWLRYVVKPDPARCKYWHLMRAFFSLATLVSRPRELFWSERAKVAALTLGVKIFYVPLVTSWTINNIGHQANLLHALRLDWLQINAFIVAGLILIDVAIFTFGYVIEAPQLDNEIKSVEPTLLGWVVCLMCYPPFNSFSFLPFDVSLVDDYPASTGFWRYFALALITMLWGFYTWASVALGTKASNLTHRGVIRSGPYAYVRHPAYASKVLLWAISGWAFGDRGVVMCAALAAVYWMRAWTEERHLGRDPDYVAYMREVPYRFVPWLW